MKRALVMGAGGLGLLILTTLLAFAGLVWQVDRVGRRDNARPADTIVVLGARVSPDGQPGSDLTSRTLHAVDLWQGGYAPNMICTGGFKDEPLSAAAVCKRYAIRLGVPVDRVWVADGTTNTFEDAQATARVMATQGWQSAILVSHPLHLYRAQWLFSQTGLQVVTSPTTTATDRILLPLRIWYGVQEAGAIVYTAINRWVWLPPQWAAGLHTLTYRLR